MKFLLRILPTGASMATIVVIMVATASAAMVVSTATTPTAIGGDATTQTAAVAGSASTSSTLPGTSSSSTSTSTLPGTSTSSTSTLPNGSTSTSTSTTSTTIPGLPANVGPVQTVTVLDAGTVDFVVDGALLRIADVFANDGWSPTVERAVSREVEVSFRNGSARVDLNLELEDGQIRVRIRDRRTDTRTEVRIPAGGSSGLPSSTSTSTTVPSTSIPTSTTSPIADSIQTFSSVGGDVTVSINGGNLTLISTNASSGYSTDIHKSDSDDVEVRFESGNSESRIEIEIRHGQLRTEIENR